MVHYLRPTSLQRNDPISLLNAFTPETGAARVMGVPPRGSSGAFCWTGGLDDTVSPDASGDACET